MKWSLTKGFLPTIIIRQLRLFTSPQKVSGSATSIPPASDIPVGVIIHFKKKKFPSSVRLYARIFDDSDFTQFSHVT